MSAQAKADNPVPRTKLGYIDDDFDPSTYPQVLPKVRMDGQPLSDRGYTCLSSYFPIPGDRVILLPHGISYVILGSIGYTGASPLDPGELYLFINNDGSSGSQSANAEITWGSSLIYDPLSSWNSSEPTKIQMGIGRYLVSGSVGFPTSSNSRFRHAEIRRDGSAVRAGRSRSHSSMTNQLVNLQLPTIAVNVTEPSVLSLYAFFSSASSGSPEESPGTMGSWGSGKDASSLTITYLGQTRGTRSYYTGLSDI